MKFHTATEEGKKVSSVTRARNRKKGLDCCSMANTPWVKSLPRLWRGRTHEFANSFSLQKDKTTVYEETGTRRKGGTTKTALREVSCAATPNREVRESSALPFPTTHC
jgi:hypothetical protein